QAEDGIRDWSVTGVQTCALPICFRATMQDTSLDHGGLHVLMAEQCLHGPNIGASFQQLRGERVPKGMTGDVFGDPGQAGRSAYRSEERRGGKEWRFRRSPRRGRE